MRSALITGAGKRIGGAIARDLAAHGWRVLLHAHRSAAAAEELAREIANAGGHASVLTADLAGPSEPQRLMMEAFGLAPDLELVVSNASSFTFDDARTVSAEALNRNFVINAVAPILLAQSFAEILPPNRKGAIVVMLDNRVVAPNPDYFSYGISKFAAFGATKMLAQALAPRIRVNGIAPGITLPSGGQSEEAFARAHRLNPLGQGCSPEEIAAAVRLIAASPAMTGTVITIDGGLSLANPGRDVAFVEPRDR